MNKAEATQLLTAAAAFDNRDPSSEAAARAWAFALADIPLDQDAFAAVAEFYTRPEPNGEVGGRRWLEPHQFRAVRKKIRDARTTVLVDDGVPDETPQQYLARRREAERAAGDGAMAEATPLRMLGPAPANGPDMRTAWLDQQDVAAMRQEGGIGEWIVIQWRAGLEQARARRAMILRHPDLAAKLAELPLGPASPEQWTGAIPPELFNGVRNDSPRRPAILALLAEAERREAAA